MENLYLKNILDTRHISLYDLWMLLHKEISLKDLSLINIGSKQITQKDVDILDKYLDLTDTELKYLYQLTKINMVFKSQQYVSSLLNKIPDKLNHDEFIQDRCPFCNNVLVINKSINNDINVVCSREGLLMIK